MQRIKSYGSSLHNISKKRQAQMESGDYVAPKRKPLAHASKKAISEWTKARNECWNIWGGRCAITLKPLEKNNWHCHHAFLTRQQSPKDKYNTKNLVPMTPQIHSRHTGADKQFYDWQSVIRKNAEMLGIETL